MDELTFQRAQRLLRERGEDAALRRSNPGDYLLSGLVRCGRCRRAYVGMPARGNGGVYHYYACSCRQKLGRKGCDGERIPRDKLEQAVLSQLASLYRDEALIERAVAEAASKHQGERPALEERVECSPKRPAEPSARSIATAERSSQASSRAARFQTPVSALEARLEALREQDHALAHELGPEAPTTPERAELAAVAEHLERTIAEADPKQAKALLRLLINELRVNGRAEILPTYRVVTPEVCALPSSVGRTEHCANHDLLVTASQLSLG